MGNWRTVRIIGKVAKSDIEALRQACRIDKDYKNFHCLSIGTGLMGLGDWVNERIDIGGNLAERNYDIADISSTLEKLVDTAPSMDLKVHCGSENEDETCVATITVRNKKVEIGAAEVEFVKGVSHEESIGRLYKAIMKK